MPTFVARSDMGHPQGLLRGETSGGWKADPRVWGSDGRVANPTSGAGDLGSMPTIVARSDMGQPLVATAERDSRDLAVPLKPKKGLNGAPDIGDEFGIYGNRVVVLRSIGVVEGWVRGGFRGRFSLGETPGGAR